jgi:hypothetical protein
MVGMHQTDNRRKYFVDSIRNAYPQFLLPITATLMAFKTSIIFLL